MQSIGPSVQNDQIFNFFNEFLLKMSNCVEKFHFFNLGSFFELEKMQSIGPSVKKPKNFKYFHSILHQKCQIGKKIQFFQLGLIFRIGKNAID